MSEAITAYTTTDAIRGAIGLTDNEVTDAMLVDQNLALELENDLLGWIPTHATLYAAGLDSGASAAEKQQAALLILYSQWFCAAQALTVMTLSIPQAIADGKDEMKRFQAMDLEALMERRLLNATGTRSSCRIPRALPRRPLSASWRRVYLNTTRSRIHETGTGCRLF